MQKLPELLYSMLNASVLIVDYVYACYYTAFLRAVLCCAVTCCGHGVVVWEQECGLFEG